MLIKARQEPRSAPGMDPGSARQILAAGGYGQLAVFDAFDGDQFIGDFLEAARGAAHPQHFQTGQVTKTPQGTSSFSKPSSMNVVFWMRASRA